MCVKTPVCSAIPLPKNDYPIWESVGDEIVETGKLSKLQLEGVRYACKKHLEILSSGERAGFFIGDGAGVGKGRQIAGTPPPPAPSWPPTHNNTHHTRTAASSICRYNSR